MRTLIEDLMNKNLIKYLDNKLSKNKLERDCLTYMKNNLSNLLRDDVDILTIDGKFYWSDDNTVKEGY